MERIQIAEKLICYRESIGSWAEEAFADAVGVLLAGPAFGIAFARFLGTFFPLDAASRTHPPIALRIELIGQLIQAQGYEEHLSPSGTALLADWTTEAAKFTSYRSNDAKLNEVIGYLVRDIRAQQPILVAAASTAVGSRAYEPHYVKADVDRGNWMYELGIPSIEEDAPSGSGVVPLAPARIFGAAWMAYLQALAGGSDTLTVSEVAGRIAEVLLGSLDGADAVRAWERVK